MSDMEEEGRNLKVKETKIVKLDFFTESQEIYGIKEKVGVICMDWK